MFRLNDREIKCQSICVPFGDDLSRAASKGGRSVFKASRLVTRLAAALLYYPSPDSGSLASGVNTRGTHKAWLANQAISLLSVPDPPLPKMKIKKILSYQVQSESDKNKWYKVVLKKVGRGFKATCSCPHNIYRKLRCKHIRQAIEVNSYGY